MSNNIITTTKQPIGVIRVNVPGPQGPSGTPGSQGPQGIPGPIGNIASGSYGSFYDTGSYLATSATTIYSMSLSTTDISNGVFVSGSDKTRIYFTDPGVYNVQFSAQFTNSENNVTHDLRLWPRKNNLSDIIDSNSVVTVPGAKSGTSGKIIAAWNFFVSASANDFIQMLWNADDANVITLATQSAGTSPVSPRTPSLILTANRIDTFFSNTGSFSGSFRGTFTGSLSGTASYALNTSLNTSSFVSTSSFNAYTSSANTAISLKAPVINPTFTNNITVDGQAKVNMLVNYLAAGVIATAQDTSSLFTFTANSYRAIILDVHTQNNVSSSVYSMSTVTALYEPNYPSTFVIQKIETLQSSGTGINNEIFEKIDYIGEYDSGGEGTHLIRVVNNLPETYTIRFLARGIPNT
jgi:hypothetical protein